MNKPTKLAVALISLFSSSAAWSDNLLEVYRLAQTNDPTYLASEAGTLAANERVNQSLASLLPQINASISASDSHSESSGTYTVFGAVDDPSTPLVDESLPQNSANDSDSSSTGYKISLNQEIYNHATWLNLKQSEKRALQSNINHESAKQDLVIRVAEAYFNVLAAMDSVEFSKAETEAVSKELAQTKQRFAVGLIAMTDVHEAQSRHDRAIASQISAQNALDNAHEALQLVTGQYHYDLLQLKEEISLKNPQPEDIKSWIKQAEDNNVSVKASRIGLEIAKKNIDIAFSGHYPTLDLSASYSDGSGDTDSNGTRFFGSLGVNSNTNNDGDQIDRSISLNLNIPIYSGGRTNSQVKENQSLYQQAVHNLEAEHRRSVSQTRSAYLGVVAAVSSVNALKQAVISSQSALEATQAGFEVGTRTIVDVLLQTQQLFSAKRDHARARYDYILQTLRLKQATGLLTEKDLEQINKMLR